MPLLQIKSCSKCEAVKPTSEFGVEKRCKDGFTSICTACDNARGRAARMANPHRRLEVQAKYRASHRKQLAKAGAEYRELNREACNARTVKSQNKKPEKKTAALVRYRVSKFQATPKWADPLAIESIYKEARRLTKETGIEHHVDHEIPLRGKLVSGLHVEFNLRAIPASENIKKNNKYEVA